MAAGPGYLNTADHSDWDNLYRQAATSVSQRVVLNYQNRIQTTYSTHWADRIAAALMTVMIDGGATAIVASLQVAGTTIGTVYDIMARTLVGIVEIADKLKEQVKALLGHMLVFAGKPTVKITELSYKFIRWVLSIVLDALARVAGSALSMAKVI